MTEISLPNIQTPSTVIWLRGDNVPNTYGESSPIVFTQNPEAVRSSGSQPPVHEPMPVRVDFLPVRITT